MGNDKDLERLRRAVEEDPKNAKAYLNLGKYLFSNGNYEEALDSFSKALTLDSDCAETYYCIGLVHEMRNSLEEAKGMYMRALDLDPQYELAQNHLNKITEF
ncbi:MAG: tetratricopeptide repeat protein [bacterium]